MPKVLLTDITIRNLTAPKRGQLIYTDTNLKGFGLRISQGGSKTFVLQTGPANNRTLKTIGRYPAMTLAQARKLAMAAKTTAPQFETSPETAHEAFRSYESLYLLPNYRPATAYRTLKLLQKHFAPLMHRPLASLTTREILNLYPSMSQSNANHLHGMLRTFFNWARRRKLISVSPLAEIEKPYRETSRDRVLSDDELKRVWDATETMGDYGTIVKLCILTGQRRGEVSAISPEWIRENMLTIPAALTKNKRQHSIPLPTLSMKLLDACPFSSNSWSKNKRRLDQLSGVSNWKLHDLRRSFSTIHAQIGTQPHIIEALLNHASGQISGVASIYNRYRYFDEMTQAMRAYETHLKRVLQIP